MQNSLKTALLLIATCAISTGSCSAFAHDGHGLGGSHWHATDALGFIAMLGVIALAVWLSRGKK